MKIKLTTPLGGHATGDTIDVTPKTAELLKNAGHVEEPKPRTKKTDDTE